MTIPADRYIEAETVSEGWLDAVRLVRGVRGNKVVHLLVRIRNPEDEVAGIRAGAQNLIDTWNARKSPSDHLWDVESVRNTIFPAAWARRNPEPKDLSKYYLDRYTKDGLLGFNENSRGTYFGRVIAYPRGAASVGDQLTETVRKLRAEKQTPGPKSSRYEINVYNERLDTGPMGFPCLAHMSVHLHEGRLAMQAIYRNEYLVGRAYGNFLGLAEFQAYIARAAKLKLGELLMTIGHAELEAGHLTAVDKLLEAFPEKPAD